MVYTPALHYISLLVCLDTVTYIEVVMRVASEISSQLPLALMEPTGPNNTLWEWMQTAVGLYCGAWPQHGKDCVWVDVFESTIPFLSVEFTCCEVPLGVSCRRRAASRAPSRGKERG